MSSTFLDDSAVRLADNVQHAALNYDLSLAALDIYWNGKQLPRAKAVETAFVPSTR